MKMILLMITLFIFKISALHFYLIEGKEKCFMDDIPGRTVYQLLNN